MVSEGPLSVVRGQLFRYSCLLVKPWLLLLRSNPKIENHDHLEQLTTDYKQLTFYLLFTIHYSPFL